MRFEDREIKYLKGVGEVRAKLLASQLEVATFRDLLDYYPFRYVDRSRYYLIEQFHGEMPYLQVKGHFISFVKEGEGKRQRLKGIFSDGHKLMECVWFSKISYFEKQWVTGKEYVIFGKPTVYNHIWSISHPEVEAYNADRPRTGLQGVYSISESLRKRGFTQRMIQEMVSNLVGHPQFNQIEETLPAEVMAKFRFPSIQDTYRSLHFPENADALRRARERMKFEELFYLELQILRYSRDRGHRIAGHIMARIGDKFNAFYRDCLPFDLTGAQKRVLREIRDDMRTGRQMNRLLQGDVGSGKTMVAFMTMLMSVDNGFQAAMMAPTEILAGQHFESLLPWCRRLGIDLRLLTGSTRAVERREILSGLASGDVNIVVGTHALIEDKVEFANLGVAVIDEQHRFGVAQRAKMWRKASTPPHVLVMTATPIPRTLAMTVYGDLEVSVIDELPPGRKPVQTWLRTNDNRGEINRHIWRQIQEGRQVYIVYPLVKENEKLDLRSLEAGYEITRHAFPEVSVSMVHGQMPAAEKEREMQKFVDGTSRILVATTVIEVGVNVPNATVMVIENAERFGLSQLHQLRGRVGRGADMSWCILVSKRELSSDTRKRLNIMTETTDGFLISEADMKLRGPGDMEGTQQSGVAFNLKMANLATDGQILQCAREMAMRILDSNPECNARSESARGDVAWRLGAASLQILSREMHRRFFKQVDWSAIS